MSTYWRLPSTTVIALSFPLPSLWRGGQGVRLPVADWHAGLRVTRARGGALRRHGVDPGEVALAQRDVDGLGVFREPAALLRAGNRHDVLPPGQEPGQRQLRRCTALFVRDFLDPANQVQVLLEVRLLKPG